MTLVGEPHGAAPMPIELEAALMIVADRPAEIAKRVGDLRDLGGFLLIPQPTLTIHDVYFDTPGRLLAAADFGLRVRECGADRWVTLKGQTLTPDSGPMARFELELPWLRRHLHRIAAELSRRGVALPGRIRRFDGEPPVEVMRDLGLDTLQRRSTRRVRRHVVRAGEASAPALAELAVDAVRYHLDTWDAGLWEIEIEATDSGDHGLLLTLRERLVDRIGAALWSWHFSKLATGSAIAELEALGRLEGSLHADGALMPAAIEKIAERLARHNTK